MKKISEFKVGERAALRHQITVEDVKKFVDLTGDDNPLHTNADFAEKTSFKGIVTHGMLTASFVSTIIGKHLPGEGALWVSQSFDFLHPVRLGDLLDVSAEVSAVHARQNLLHLSISVSNQKGQKVLRGTAQVKVMGDAPDAAADGLEKAAPLPKYQGPKVALVTGAGRGIGAAVAKRLSRDGFHVAVNYRSDAEAAEKVCAEIKSAGGTAICVQADISSEKEVDRLFKTVVEKLGPISALVNNASPSIIDQKLEEVGWDEITRQMETQVKGSLLCLQQAMASFQRRGEGSVVNIGSQVTDSNPPALWTAYSLAKAALHQLTRQAAEALGSKSIRVNTVSPGMTSTDLISHLPEKAKLLMEAQTPLKKIASPEEIAEAVSFFVSPAASHITGQTIRVNGGRGML